MFYVEIIIKRGLKSIRVIIFFLIYISFVYIGIIGMKNYIFFYVKD